MDGLQKMEKPYFLMDDLGGKRNPTIFGVPSTSLLKAVNHFQVAVSCHSLGALAPPTHSWGFGMASGGKTVGSSMGMPCAMLDFCGFMAKRKRFKAQEIP